MKRKAYILFTFFWLILIGAFSQNQFNGIVSGVIIEKESHNPIELAKVAIRDLSDTSKIVETLTDIKGKFRFEKLSKGNYSIIYSFIGYGKEETPVFTIDEKNKEIQFRGLSLTTSNLKLNEVVISGKRSTFVNSIDRKVFNVGEDLIGKSGSVSELLQNVPSVTVDMDGIISLRGSESVMILINGKPSALMGANRAAVLQQMPANSIEKIEVITNPSAKYKPDGTSGIINIVLKKNKSLGMNGTIMGNIGNDDRYNGNIITNYNSGKFNIFGSYGLRQDDRKRYNTDLRRKTDSLNQVSFTDLHSNDKSRPISQIFNAGIDYKLNDNNQLGVSGNYNYRNQNKVEKVNTLLKDANSVITKNYDRNRIDPEMEEDLEFSANFKHSFSKEGHELTIDYTSSASNEVEDNHYTNIINFPNAETTYDNTLIKQGDKESQLSIQYSNPITEESLFETGYILESRQNDMDFYGESLNPLSATWQKDLQKTNHFIYTENIHVLFATYERTFGKFGFLAGLRSEMAFANSNQITTDSIFKSTNFKLYPSLHMSYKLSDINELQLNYSHRVRRPEGDELNPFPEYQNPYNLRIGNPRLKPEDIHSIEFGYQYNKKNTTFLSTLYYRYRFNGLTSITKYLNDSVLINTAENLSKSSSLGLELIASTTLAQIINLNLSTNTFLSTIDASNLGYSSKKSSLSWTANLNSTVNLTKSSMLQVSSNYSSLSLTPQGKRLPSFVTNLGLKQEFLKNKVSALFTISDVFNTMQNSSIIDTPELYQKTVRKRSARLIYVGISYNFGSQKKKDTAIKFDNQL